MLDDFSTTVRLEALNDPVTASFDAHWGTFADTFGTARALPPDIGPFATIGHKPANLVALVQARKMPVILLSARETNTPKGLHVLQRMQGVQMVPVRALDVIHDVQFKALGPADAADMVTLAQMTKPGPFEVRTHLLGDFIGLRKGGKLVAMAGQRMAFNGWVEISAVCVHPDFRNRGLARGAVSAMIDIITRRGANPFLHTFADNTAAIALYRQMGFEVRTPVTITKVA